MEGERKKRGEGELVRCGFGDFFRPRGEVNVQGEIGRVSSVHKAEYELCTTRGRERSEIAGKIQFRRNPMEKPTVGDWVVFERRNGVPYIVGILPRRTLLKRQKEHWPFPKPIAANVDTAFLVQAFGQDIHPQRIARILLHLHEAGVRPVFVFHKRDLAAPEEEEKVRDSFSSLDPDVPILFTSTREEGGLDVLRSQLIPRETFVLLGSSGVGKSSIVNALVGEEVERTAPVNEKTGKGRHTTTRRYLVELPNGALLIDTPGTRAFMLAEKEEDLVKRTFPLIESYAQHCRFPDCSHRHEPGCAVREAVEQGNIPRELYEDYLTIDARRSQSARTERRAKMKKKR